MKSSDEHSVEDANRFLNDHERPSYGKLHALAGEDTPESLETLRQLADDHNVDYDETTTADEIVDRLILAMDQEINHSI